ncbi:MAG: hypothetical protein ABI621_05890 [Chloroflexota bacterium]
MQTTPLTHNDIIQMTLRVGEDWAIAHARRLLASAWNGWKQACSGWMKKALEFYESICSIFCMNSFNFYGGNTGFIEHLLQHLKPGGQLCIGSEVLSTEFTAEQKSDPPAVYAFKLPPPNEHVDVFEGDFKKQHTAIWWRDLIQSSGLMQVEYGNELEDTDRIHEELVRYEYENNIDPFDVQICLDQIEWGITHQPRKTLFVLTARKC